jgi:multiple sugar transport system permease protein
MQDSSLATRTGFDVGAPPISPERRNLGRALMTVATGVLAAAVALQLFKTIGWVERGFDNWRPVLYAYIVWAIALGIGLVLVKGQRGHRALFVLPAVLFTVSLVVFPTLFGFYVAFTDWNLSAESGRRFSGLNNLRTMWNDSYFWNALKNMVYYSLSVLVQYAIALGLALLLNADIRFRKFFRTAFLLPFMLSPVAVGWMIGKSIFEPRYGPASILAKHLGWDSPAFFASPWIARASIAAMDAWVWIPFMMVLLLAGLQALPGEVMESAKVDGASGWQSFWQMVFPIMLPVTVTAIILRTIFELKLADLVLTVTGGAPGGATDTVSSYVYRQYATRASVGYGTAMAQVYLILIIIAMLILLWLVGKSLRRVS